MADSLESPPPDLFRAVCFQPMYPIMDSYPPICFSKTADVNDDDEDPSNSLQRAVDKDPRNPLLTLPPEPAAPVVGGPLHLAMDTRRFWRAGRELKIRFMGGSNWQRNHIKEFAPEWCEHANLHFTFVDSGECDILISFDPSSGSWSYIGTDCTRFSSQNRPSMNLGWINDSKSRNQIRSVILHQLGHAIGAVHEHMSPVAQIRWDKERIYSDLGGRPNNWTREEVDRNVFTLPSPRDVKHTDFDSKSIMVYYYPESWTIDGETIPFNTSLSDLDKAFARFAYPPDTLDPRPFSTTEDRPRKSRS